MPTLIISVYVMYLHIHKEIVCTCIQNNLYTYMYFTLSMSISISLSIYIYIYLLYLYIYLHVIPCPYTSQDSDLTISARPSIFWAFAAPALLSAAKEVPPVLGGTCHGCHGWRDFTNNRNGCQWVMVIWLGYGLSMEQNHNQNCYSLDVWYGDLMMVVFHGTFHGDLMVVQSSKKQGCEWIYPAW